MNPRVYGAAPYSVAVLHGGPGAAGEMAPVARALASRRGVLEPLQTADTVEGQLAELRDILARSAELPAVLIGFSWGAMLAFMYTAHFPGDVRKLILVSSGAFEDEYAERILPERLSRLTGAEKAELETLLERFEEPAAPDLDAGLARLGEILSRADAYRPIADPGPSIVVDFHIHQRVWDDVRALRSDGRLLDLGRSIRCPVVAIHGDFDPHPADGVRIPLARVVPDFRFVLLERCGHRPWIELEARGAFFALLESELSSPG